MQEEKEEQESRGKPQWLDKMQRTHQWYYNNIFYCALENLFGSEQNASSSFRPARSQRLLVFTDSQQHLDKFLASPWVRQNKRAVSQYPLFAIVHLVSREPLPEDTPHLHFSAHTTPKSLEKIFMKMQWQQQEDGDVSFVSCNNSVPIIKQHQLERLQQNQTKKQLGSSRTILINIEKNDENSQSNDQLSQQQQKCQHSASRRQKNNDNYSQQQPQQKFLHQNNSPLQEQFNNNAVAFNANTFSLAANSGIENERNTNNNKSSPFIFQLKPEQKIFDGKIQKLSSPSPPLNYTQAHIQQEKINSSDPNDKESSNNRNQQVEEKQDHSKKSQSTSKSETNSILTDEQLQQQLTQGGREDYYLKDLSSSFYQQPLQSSSPQNNSDKNWSQKIDYNSQFAKQTIETLNKTDLSPDLGMKQLEQQEIKSISVSPMSLEKISPPKEGVKLPVSCVNSNITPSLTPAMAEMIVRCQSNSLQQWFARYSEILRTVPKATLEGLNAYFDKKGDLEGLTNLGLFSVQLRCVEQMSRAITHRSTQQSSNAIAKAMLIQSPLRACKGHTCHNAEKQKLNNKNRKKIKIAEQ